MQQGNYGDAENGGKLNEKTGIDGRMENRSRRSCEELSLFNKGGKESYEGIERLFILLSDDPGESRGYHTHPSTAHPSHVN